MKGMHYHCPVNGWDCLYYKDTETIHGVTEYCLCKIPGDPYEECDDFFEMWGEDIPSLEYTDFVDED